MHAEAASMQGSALSSARTQELLNMLLLAPYGVQAMSMDLPGLVQTSLNLGVAETNDKGVRLGFSVRSSIQSQKEALVVKLDALCGLLGASFNTHDPYPAWAFKKKSRLRDAMAKACAGVYGKAPNITATHGGLECGLFMEKRPDFDCVSLGPDLREVHSVRERLSISSTEKLYRVVRSFVENWE
jgi:dipeptidase D